MTRHQPALSALASELLEDLRLTDEELFCRLLQAGLQDLLDAQASAKFGADRCERPRYRSASRNGTRAKRLVPLVGELDLAILKLRTGSFFLALPHPRRRVGKALRASICAALIDGGSTLRVSTTSTRMPL